MKSTDRNKKCLFCGKVFYCKRLYGIKKWNSTKYCSQACYRKAGSGRKRSGKYIPCAICGKIKYYRQGAIDGRIHYCSQKCKVKGQIKKALVMTCKHCGKDFTPKTHGKYPKYCSYKCARLERTVTWLNGENNPNWKGGVTPENKKVRHSLEYKTWRDSVFERDNFTCQKCGKHGGNLHVHHIKSFALHAELRTDIANGETLCIECHRKVSKIDTK